MENKKSRKKIQPTEKEILRAETLKKLRMNLNLSLEEAGKRIGISAVTLSRYENTDITNIPMDKIEGLAKVYRVNPGYIMGWKDSSSKKISDPYFVDTSVLTTEELLEFEKITGVNKQLFFNDVDEEHDMALFKQSVIDILISQREKKKK